MKNSTHISWILDRSGSMQSVKTDTIGGFNRFLQDQKKESGECTISLHQFDDKYETLYENKPIKDAPELTDETFIPRGWTALLDAIGKTINTLGESLSKLSEENRPAKILVVISTDGEENSSKEFSREKIFEMIKHQEEKYNWSFIYLGANQDAIKNARGYGISANSAINYAASAVGTSNLYRSMSNKVSKLRADSNVNAKISFDDQDREEILKNS